MENYIALNIKYLREKQRVSQKALSDLLGKKNSSSIAHYEKGNNLPPIDEIVKICIFFNVDLNDFVNIDLKSINNDVKSNNVNIKFARDNENTSILERLNQLERKMMEIEKKIGD